MPSPSDRRAPPPPNADDAVVLDFHHVEKSFRAAGRQIRALADVSLQVRRGRVTGLIGPDGAGKTTLMRLAAGLLLPEAGRVTVLGWDTATNALDIQGAVGYMPQQFGLYEDLTVLENLNLYADLQGQPKAARPERYRQLMKMTALGAFQDRLAGRLSGGMKQKLGLACTLVRPPRLLLLDEPTAGVDPVSRRELWTIVGEAVAAEGMSVLLSTAYLDEADRCDEVALVDEGRLLGMGTPRSFGDRVRNRTFLVTAGTTKSRTLQDRLADAEGVADAVVQGQSVRLVMDEGLVPTPETLLPKVEGVSIEPVEPRFEDGFIAMLRAVKGEPRRQPEGHSTSLSLWERVGVRVSGSSAKDRSLTLALSQRERGDVAAEPIIEVRDVRRRFGRFYAVKGVSFDVRRGEIFGLLGANGAGKSTTFRMLCGLLPPSAGALRVAGVDVRRAAAAARARIGYMPQKFSLYGTLSVEQNLRFFSSAYGLAGRRRAERIAWAVDKFAMHEWRGARGDDLPLGFKKRLSMACALMHDPDVLFLDEPTSGVDPLARREFWREINALAAQGVTIMVTTHFMEEAEYCDRLAIMAAGEILCEGTPEEIRATAPRRNGHEPTIEDAFIGLIERREQQPAGEG